MTSSRASNRSHSGVYGIVGRRISYSMSPHIFCTIFDALAWRADYAIFDIESNELKSLLGAMRTAPIRGLNVTQPYKTTVIGLMDRIDERVSAIGAVNTVALERGQLVGYNTDVDGVIFALRPYRRALRGQNAVIFGAGGGARAVAYTLLEHFGMRGVTVAARRPTQARRLIRDLQERMSPPAVASAAFRPASDLDSALAEAHLIVNATPLGMGRGHGESPLPKRAKLLSGAIAFDLVYRPRPTSFNLSARRAGCKITIDGWPMLIAQAEAAFRLWTGRAFPGSIRTRLLSQKTIR